MLHFEKELISKARVGFSLTEKPKKENKPPKAFSKQKAQDHAKLSLPLELEAIYDWFVEEEAHDPYIGYEKLPSVVYRRCYSYRESNTF